MEGNDLLDISQTKAEALDIMNVTSMDAVEFVEDLLDVLFLDAQSRITNTETEAVLLVPCTDIDIERLFWFTILDSVIHQIGDGVLEMHLIDIDGRINGLNLGKDLTTGMLYTKRE